MSRLPKLKEYKSPVKHTCGHIVQYRFLRSSWTEALSDFRDLRDVKCAACILKDLLE